MNSNKNMKIYLIFTLVVMFFCCPQIYAYYSKNDSKSVTIGTKDLIITGSTSATTYAADSNGVVSIPVTIKNNSGFAVNYNLTLSNTNLKFNDGKTVYRGTIAANTTSTVTLKIVEVNPLGTENTDIDMAVTGPYTKNIEIGSYVLTYDLTPPSCSFSTSSTVLTGNTTTVSVTCTDASGVKTTSLATSAISLKSSLGTLSNPTVTSVTNGYKYSFTYTAGSKAGTETFTLIAGKVSDNVNNTNAATTGTITVQRQVKGTFNINGASSFTYNGTKYTSTTTLTLCTLSSETTCSVTMPTITASTNTPTVIGWSTAAGTHTATYTSGQTVSISNNVTLYAQTTKAEITREVIFGCNGGSGKVSSTSCTISATYNGTAQGTSCTATLPTSGCTYSGWNFQGWNTSDTATTGVTGSVSISSNKTYYAIWKKNAITYTLSFNTNLINNAGICSASATAPASQKCTISAVYNGTTQATSCTVTIPTLFDYQTGEWDFNGWGTSSSSTSGVDSGSQVTLSSNKTLYATWAKPVTLRFNANGCATESKTVSQTLYNFNVNSTVTVPSVTMNTNWTSLGVSSSASSTSQGTAIGSSMSYNTQCSNSVHDFYYNCKKDVTVVFNDNKCTTASKNATTTLYNGGTSASVTVPTVTMNSGWKSLGASSSSTSTSSGTAMGSTMSMTVGSAVITVNRYYNCSKDVSVTFNANGCTTSNQTATMKLHNGGESSSVVVPTATMISNWVNFGASASSSSKSAGTSMGASMTISGVASATTSVTRYYNCGKAARIDIKANGCTTADGIVEFDLYNGATTATVTIPTATMKTNWTSLGASTSASSTSGGTAMGSSTTVTVASASKSTTYYYNCKKDVTVTFNANSCTSASGSVTKTLYNGATSTAVTVPTKDMINTTWNTLGASASASSTSQGTAMGSSMTISSIGSSTTSVNRYYNCYKEVGVNFYSNYCTTDTGWVNSTIYNGATSVTVSMPTDYTAESGRTIKGASTDGSSHSASSTVTVPLGDLRNSIGYAYFICTRNFDIIFKANGCATGDKTVSKTLYSKDDSFTVDVPAPTMKTGWTNLGAASSSTATSGSTSTVSVSTSGYYTSETFYYTCTKPAIKYTATYNCNGGTGNVSSTSCTIDAVYNGESQASSCSVTAPTSGCTYSGWDFQGWNASSTATSGFTGAVDITKNHTWYAIWKKPSKKYTVTFYGNGGSGNTASESCTIDAAYNGDDQATNCYIEYPENGFTYSGWTFNGWASSASYTGGNTPGAVLAISADTPRYATWKKDVTVTFNANSCASESKAATTTIYNGATTASVTVPTPTMNTNWTTLGASTSSSATSGTAAGSSLSVSVGSTSKTGTAYFICKKDVTVTFNTNGCASESKTASKTIYNGATTASVTVPTPSMNTSWTTLGASTSSSATSGTTAGNSLSVSVGSTSKTGTAYFICKKDVTVTFNTNGCASESKTASKTIYNGATTASVTVPTPTMNTNWTTLGASTSSSATSGTTAGSSLSVSIGSTSKTGTAYFICKKDVTVVFNDNKCTTASKNATTTLYNGNTSASVTVPTATMNSEWTTLGASSSSSTTSSGTSMGSTMSMTVGTAVITVNRYYNCYKDVTVTFKANGCTTSDQTATMKLYNGGASNSVVVPTATMNSGWTTLGASASASSTSNGTAMGSSMTIGSIASTTTTATRYYNCTKAAKSYTATFDCNGGTGTPAAAQKCTIAATYNGTAQETSCKVTVPSTPGCSKSSWTWIGWGTSSASTSSSYGNSSVITLTASKTFYSVWQKAVTVTFNANGCTTAAQTATMNLYNGATSGTVTVPSATMNTNWTTLGASASSSSTSSGTAMGSSMTISSISATQTSATRYYNCKKDVTVTFNANSCATAAQTATTTLYNGSTSATVTVPTATMNTSWTSLGASASSSAMTSGTSMGSTMSVTIATGSKTATRYYNCRKEATITFNANGCTTGNATATGYLYNGATTGGFTVPSATLKSGWSDLDASTSSGATTGTAPGGTLTGISVGSTSTTGTAYFVCNKTVTVTFNANGCTTSGGSDTFTVYNGGTSGTVTVPSATMNTNWTTLGASASASSTSSGTSMGSSMSITGVASATTSVTRYYNCSKAVTVTFNANGCTTTSPTSSMTLYNGATSGSTTVPSATEKTSWTLLGASASSSSTSSGTAIGSSMTISGVASSSTTATRYFNCSKDITVTFKANSCTTADGTATKTLYNGATSTSVTVPSATMKTGWTSLGASTSSSSTSQGTAMGSSMSLTVASSVTTLTRYYNCTKPAITRTAKFSCNVGSGTVANDTCKIAAVYNGTSQATSCTVTLPTTGCSLSGFDFVGWNISSSGKTGGTGDISISEDKQYYAIYKKDAITYTLSFASAASGASGSTASKTCTIPAVYNGDTQDSYCSVTLPSNGFTYSGWTFNGWGSYSSSTSGSKVGATVGLTSNQTRYATWVKASKSITVSYNCTNGSGSTGSTSCTIPAVYNGATQDTSCDVALATNSCTYSGWTFAGWGTYSGATSGTAAGATVTVSSAQTRYAVWRKTLTLTCSKGANVSSIGATSRTCYVYNGSTAGCSVTLPSITPNSGYTSVGWSTSSGATSGTAAGSSITITGNTTRYANATDQTAPTCGTVTGAGTSSTWRQSRTITVACSESGGSGCSQDSFSKTFNSGTHTSGTITISDAAGNTRDCTVATYIDNTDPTCGRVTGASTEWSKSKTIGVACTDEHSGCVKSEYSQTFSSGTATTKSIYIYDSAGNSTACTVNAYIDNNGPTCGTITGASTTWTTSSRNISVACSDSGSGCTQTSYSKSFTETKVGTITLTDEVGNTTNCSVNAYADITPPSCEQVTGASTSWITSGNRDISVGCSDSVSGCTQSTFSYLFMASRKTGTITIKNNAGLTRDCTVNVYIDTVPPTCGTVTNASTSWRNTTQTLSVGCSDSVSGCSNATVSKSFSNTGIGTITISDAAGNTKDCSVNAYVDTTAPTCGTVTNGSTSWRNTTQSISVACSDNLSDCTSTSFSGNFSNATTGSITISDKAGNTKSCSVNAYVDIYAPSCGTCTNCSTSWRTTSQTISVACSDTGVSGCKQSSFSKSFSATQTGTITISDNAGNTKSCDVNAYVDTSKPSITCTVNSGGTSGVSATVSASDGVSGLSTNPSGSKTGLKSSTTYTAKNGAGLTASCTVTVTKSVSSHTKYTYKCTKATWGAGSQTTVSSCTARTQSTANSSNYAQYWTCSNQFGSVCTNAGLNASGCYYKTTYTRNGCSTYSSSASNTSTGLSSCSASSNNYYKYTCSTIYTYSGSA